MLRVENITKSFDDFQAVDGAELTVDRGRLVAVIGPNGAGKTTLFNLITGQLKPDKGRVVFNDEEIHTLPAHRICKRGISRSFQIANIFSRLDVFRNVQVSVLARRGKSGTLFHPAHQMAIGETTRILKRAGLYEKRRLIADSLSHGDKRVLEIAIALGNEPKLLILDEPTAGMSPEETATTIAMIKDLAAARGITILFCEHDMDLVFNIAESIMVMQHGRTIIQGTPQEIRQNREVQEAYLGGEGDA